MALHELYYPYSEFLKKKYGEKVYKLPVNLPLSCPNKLSGRGCVFCAESGTGFEICTHVFLNLPGDEKEDAIETAKVLSALGIPIVKIHSLYIAKSAPLCEAYEGGTITICSKEEYIDRLIAFLEHLNPDMAVERLFSRIPEKDAVFCNWGTSWWKLRSETEAAMQSRSTWQGRLFHYLGGAALGNWKEIT